MLDALVSDALDLRHMGQRRGHYNLRLGKVYNFGVKYVTGSHLVHGGSGVKGRDPGHLGPCPTRTYVCSSYVCQTIKQPHIRFLLASTI